MQTKVSSAKSTLKIITILLFCIALLGNFSITAAQSQWEDIPPDDAPSGPAPESPTLDYFVYLPLAMSAPPAVTPTFDLSVGHIGITQGTQTLINDVPLVAGRQAVLRVFSRTDDLGETPGVQLTLDAFRDGSRLPGAPIVIEDVTAHIWGNLEQLESLRGDLSASTNYQLPTEWLSGQVFVTATIDSNLAIPETDEGNNTTEIVLNFTPVPTLEVVIVPVNYWYGGDIHLFPAPTNFDYIAPRLMALYPIHNVNFTIHSSVTYRGSQINPYDLIYETGWIRLLDQINTLRRSEVGNDSPLVYYAVVPLDDGNRTTWYPGSGIQGIGFVGRRASVGLVNLPDLNVDGALIAVHEMGHNLGQDHAPCNIPVSDSDPNYPYTGGLIGQYGFNMSTFSLLPKNTPDIMGYCNNPWISDYTYKALYQDQLSTAASLDPIQQDGLYVRVFFDGQGRASIQPTYNLYTSVDPPDPTSDYQIELVGASGDVLSRHPVALLHASEPGGEMQSIHAVLPKPAQSIARVRLIHDGRVVAERALVSETISPSQAPTITHTDNGWTLTWSPADRAALIRYSSDGGQTWETLGVDITGGEFELALEDMTAGELQFEILSSDQFSTAQRLNWGNTSFP